MKARIRFFQLGQIAANSKSGCIYRSPMWPSRNEMPFFAWRSFVAGFDSCLKEREPECGHNECRRDRETAK